MTLIPTTFPAPPEAAVASYDYTDIASGLGYQNFYLYVGDDEGSDGYFLISDATVSSKFSWSTGAGALILSENFDTSPFNLPKRIRGNVIANITVGRAIGTAGNIEVEVKVYHVAADTTPTLLGAAADATINNGAAALDPKDCTMNFTIPISLTHFKKGEYIRMYLSGTADAGGASYIGHDPTNRGTSPTLVPNTNSKIAIPFVLDL